MNSERDYAPLSIACVRALNDKLYERRKAAALEIEKMVKDFAARNDTVQLKKILRVLGQDFALSQSPHARKGGLIGLAAVAIALGKDTARHIPELIQPILACFSDPDVKVRYCACESLYNVVKVARGAVLDHFTDIFSRLSNLAADPDQGVKNGSETLDRLMKDIVTESMTFDLVSFMPLLRERMSTKNDFARQFIISWISVLDTVPQIDMVLVLPEILDGLFKILEDPKAEIKTMCGTLLSEFLRSIKQDPSRVDFQGMINILAQHAQSQDDLLQFTAITWIKEFVQLSDNGMLPYTSGILIAILPCLSYEVDSKRNIKETAKAVNFSLMRLISEETPENLTEASLDLNSVTEVLTKFLLQTKVPTKVAVLKWIYHLHSKMPNRMYEHVEKLFPVLLKVLSDSSDEVVQQDLEVLAEIVSSQHSRGGGGESDNSASIETNKYFSEFINNLLRLFSTDRRLLKERGSFIIRQLCILLNPEVIYMAFSKFLSQEKNVKFISTMIDYLNTILLTSSELFELRTRLKDLSTKESCDLFQGLYFCWCHNPVATVALCLLSQNYAHACALIRTFGDLEVTVEFLTEIDKLVQLIESPIFAYLRLELLEIPHNQHLVQALYGLLMLLPQTEAFHTLRQRLDCIPSLHLYEHGSQSSRVDVNQKEKRFDFENLLQHFTQVQEQHRKEKLESRTLNLLEKGIFMKRVRKIRDRDTLFSISGQNLRNIDPGLLHHYFREQPIFTCKAHVFHIDPKTKRFWLPASNMAVSVSFFYDSTRSLYRIISVEGAKAVINSTITPNMTFTKTSQKFGQWSDVRANTVYGLGFSSESELNKFIEKFQEVKEATKLEASKKAAADGTAFATTPVTSANASPITGRAVVGNRNVTDTSVTDGNSIIDPPDGNLSNPPSSGKSENHADADKNNHGRSQSLTGLQPGESPKHQTKTEKTSQISATPAAGESQLKYENDRLKLALAQSSANAKKWEIELATLKSNNARLTSALQESTANVEEWKRQLHSYKEENVRLKTRYLELEAAKGNTEAAVELRKELNSLRQRVEQLELECKAKDEEIKRIAKSGGGHDDRCKSLSQENAELQAAVSLAQAQLETALAAQESQRRVLDTLNAQLAARVAELAGIHREVATALQT